MAIFDLAYQVTMRNEGGYTLDPHETIAGIDRKWHPEWTGWAAVDAFKRRRGKPRDLLKDPVFQNAIKIFYRQNFWPRGYDLITSQSVANILFDRGVNMGVKHAVMVAQSLVGAKADGLFGTDTIKRVNAFDSAEFCQQYDTAVDNFYERLAKNNPEKYGRFLKGWKARV